MIKEKPYFETDNLLLYNMDCMDGMKRIEEGIIDLTITSPPYNIGKEYEKVRSVEEYVKDTIAWINEVYRITKPSGSFLLNVGFLEVPKNGIAVPIPYLMWDKTPFYLIQEIVWNYGAGVACKRWLSPRNEKILWYVKNKDEYTFNLDEIRDKNVKYPNQKKNGKKRCNPLGKNPSDVWQIPKVTSGKNRASKERTTHPAQFPIEMIERIVKGFSNKNDIVLDPFIGSGTTAEAGLKEGRKVIGFEIKKRYCDIAIKRIKKIYPDQTRLTQF